MEEEEVIKEFLKLNPKAKRDKLAWENGSLKWRCEHEDHTVYAAREKDYAHDCDGCCKGIKPYHKPADKGSDEDDWHDEYRRFC